MLSYSSLVTPRAVLAQLTLPYSVPNASCGAGYTVSDHNSTRIHQTGQIRA